MEVKSIFANLIMKNYEKQGLHKSAQAHQNVQDKEKVPDTISISPQASKRLFGEIMEQSLTKGLGGVCRDENHQ